MKLSELREYQLDFEKIKESFKSEFKEIDNLRKKFVKDFPTYKILKLDIDEYVVGKQDSTTFCNRIENELNRWGNIHGSNSKKFGLYYGILGDDNSRKYRIGNKRFGTDIKKAFVKILNSIVELIENKDNFNVINSNPISPMFKGKILSVYYPNDFLNIFSASHLDYFINVFGLDNKSRSEIDKQALLLNFKNRDKVMQEWSIFEFGKFLYISFGKPNDEIKDYNIPSELKKFITKDFPPIETIKYKFVNLNIHKSSKLKSKKSKTSKKIDYSKQSKNYKRIGDRGEQIVLKAERIFLEKHGRFDLAGKINHIANEDDNAGYDIISFDLNGKKKYIEVKSTLQKIGENIIFLSSNELQVAEQKDNYYFYIVYEAGVKEPKIWKISNKSLLNDENIEKEPILYRLRINTK